MVLNWHDFAPDITVMTGAGHAAGTQWVEAKDAAKHPTVSRTVPHSKDLAYPKCH